jgi:hypothetical protein
MDRTTQQHQMAQPERRPEGSPIWENTTPRANPEVDKHDVDRGVERLETVLGR